MSSLTCQLDEDDPATQQCFSPQKSLFRYSGLVLMCFAGFSTFFCLDNPGALQDKFRDVLNMSASDFVWLYSVYSWPNIILCYIGGFFLDRVFGIRWGTIIYVSMTLFGQLLFAAGAYTNIFWLMVLGRFIFGSGAESVTIAQKSYAVLWFKGTALNTLFGLLLSIAKLGSTANSLSLESIYKAISENTSYTGPQCVGVVLFITATICVGSLICTLILGYMDNRAEKVLNRNTIENSRLVKLTDVKDFGLIFWMTVLICITYYMAIFPFISLGKVFIMTKYKFEPDHANTVISLVYAISAVFSPLFGYLIDRTGRNIIWIFISINGSIFAHGLLAFTFVNPFVCTAFLGLSYAMLASSLWPMIALIVPEHQLGTAYGITQSFQNLNLAVVNIICGIIIDNYNYFVLELFFIAWLLISMVPALIIWRSTTISIVNSND